jgi:8-amino-7-oxononanoate synthase
MHGDLCPLFEITRIAEKFGATVILDEAHSVGVFGVQGRGFAHALDLHSENLIRLVTFGKAFGAHGAVVLSSSDIREFLVNFARSFIYTTALPLSAYDRMGKSIQIEEVDTLRLKLQKNIVYFRCKLSLLEFSSVVNSPIQFVRMSNLKQLRDVEQALISAGISAKAIYAPTVAEGDEGLRISIHSFNTETEIDELVRLMST